MKFSTQEEYGLRFLVQIARHGDRSSLTIPQLARLERITAANVAKIMRQLRRNGFVKSTRGQAGGYTLARPSSEIVVGEVLGAMGSPLFDDSYCERFAGNDAPCTHAGDCSLRPLLRRVQDAIDKVMGRLTLRDLVQPSADSTQAAHAVNLPLLSASHGTDPRLT